MDGPKLTDARILIVDDEPANVEVLTRILHQAGYHQIIGTTDSRRVLDLCMETPPDIVLLDVLMPHVDGFGVLEQLREGLTDFEMRPVLMLTADGSADVRKRALSNGAKDFLVKPLSPYEVRLRVANLLRTRLLQAELKRHNERLEHRVRERTADLEAAQHETLEKLAIAAEWRDDETGGHIRRVGAGAAVLAAAIGLDERQVQLILRGAPLHDVGKIGIPDAILLKPGRYTADERRVMETHTTIGAKILAGSKFPTLKLAESIARSHHECWDGSGYPDGLREDAIPVAARIVAIVDNFDSLTHHRVYKPAWPLNAALDEIERRGGTMFDPEIVRAFLRLRQGASGDPVPRAGRPRWSAGTQRVSNP